jgi:hypothetical protein
MLSSLPRRKITWDVNPPRAVDGVVALSSAQMSYLLEAIDWLADVLARIAEHPVQKLDELLPWTWRQLKVRNRQAA